MTARWCSTRNLLRPLLVCAAHPTVEGWLDRVIGWIGNKLDELSRYASDATAGGGLQSADYLMLQCLNREIPALKHFRSSQYVHPERLYEERCCGSPGNWRPSPRMSGARANMASTITTIWRASSRRCCATSRISSARVSTGAPSGSS